MVIANTLIQQHKRRLYTWTSPEIRLIIFFAGRDGEVLSSQQKQDQELTVSQSASKFILKILQSRLQQHMNQELPDVQAGFRKGRGTRVQIANIGWAMKKASEFQKNIYFCLTAYAKAFDLLWITRNCRKILKSWEYQTT